MRDRMQDHLILLAVNSTLLVPQERIIFLLSRENQSIENVIIYVMIMLNTLLLANLPRKIGVYQCMEYSKRSRMTDIHLMLFSRIFLREETQYT